MAEISDTQKISASEVNDYYEDELSRDSEVNNPFEPAEHKGEKKPAPKKKRSFRNLRKVLLIAVAAVLVFLIAFLLILLAHRRNDGARFAAKLAEGLGSQIQTAESAAEIKLKNESAFASINQVYPEHAAMAESKKTCEILDVKLPQWAIICHTEGDLLNSVTYYDYTVLVKNPLGIERKSYIDPNEFTGAMTADELKEKLGLSPFSVNYNKDGSVQRTYRYCYKDGETKGLVSYTITADFDMSGVLRGMTDARTNYLARILTEDA